LHLNALEYILPHSFMQRPRNGSKSFLRSHNCMFKRKTQGV